MERANDLAAQADFFVVIGTSLNVYPAAGVINFVPSFVPTWLLDPGEFNLDYIRELKHIRKTAVNGAGDLRKELLKHL